MALKRKRAIPASSTSNSSSSERALSESPATPNILWPTNTSRHNGMNETGDMLIEENKWSAHGVIEALPPHLDSRTRKRFRNDRPVDQVVHEITYQKLFAARGNIVSTTPPSQLAAPASKRPTAQASLHDFWHLPQRPDLPDLSLPQKPCPDDFQERSRCQDCEADLGWILHDGCVAMDIGIDDMAFGETDHTCRVCRRIICEMCAVVSIGEGRECLECKTSRKRWVGGIGWIPPAYL